MADEPDRYRAALWNSTERHNGELTVALEEGKVVPPQRYPVERRDGREMFMLELMRIDALRVLPRLEK